MRFLVALLISASGAPAPDPLAQLTLRAVEAEPTAIVLRLDELSAPRANHAPIADAGPDQSVREGDGVELFGAASFDPDGDSISFLWLQVAGPAVAFAPSARVANPAFAAPAAAGGPLVFELRVSDAHGSRAIDRVVVEVVSATALPHQESAPVAGEISLARR